MVENRPIFMDHRKEPVHFVWNVLEVRRTVISYVNGLLSVASPKLGDVCNCRIIQGPKCIFIERFDPFSQADLDAV